MPRRSLTAKQRATNAQAKLLAASWGNDKAVRIGGYTTPTEVVCVKNGWLTPTEFKGNFPNGQPFVFHEVSEAGLLALETFLMHERHKKI